MIVPYLTGMAAVRQGHERDAAILEFLAGFIRAHGYGPTLREIAAACQIPTISSVDYRLQKLEAVGLIIRDREISRGIRLVEASGRLAGDGGRLALLERVASAARACQDWWDTQRGEDLAGLEAFVAAGTGQGSRHRLTLARLELARALADLDGEAVPALAEVVG